MRSFFLLMVLVGIPAVSFAQVSVSASSKVSASEPAEVTIGIFRFSAGEKVALELTRQEPCVCMCQELLIKAFSVLDEQGVSVFADSSYSYPVPAAEWIGRWAFTDSAGDPVEPGRYTAVIETSVGVFRAQIELLSPGGTEAFGRSMAQASVCGISLSVYKLIDEADEGTVVRLMPGEKLLVMLQGNPTTGYTWKPVEEPNIFARVGGAEYIAMGKPVGGGGLFLFRYEAKTSGTGTLSFSYLRPWEERPVQEFSVRVEVG